MKYRAILKEKEWDLEIIPLGKNSFRISINGHSFDVNLLRCGTEILSLLIGNTSYDINYYWDDTRVHLNLNNQPLTVDVLDERRLRMRHIHSQLKLSGSEQIKTSVPGKVIRILVEKGQLIKPNSGVIIIEAMKMENLLLCSNQGIVTDVYVQPGQVVKADQVLVEITPQEN